MLVVDHYNFLPGMCSLCMGSNLPAIDTGIDLDWENSPHDENPSAIRRFYICADCAVNLAVLVADRRNLEITQAGTVMDLKTTAEEIGRRNAELYERLQSLEAAITLIKTVQHGADDSYTPVDQDADVTNFMVAKPRPKK